MKKTIGVYFIIVAISGALFFILNFSGSLDSTIIINLLIVLILQTSLILALLINQKDNNK